MSITGAHRLKMELMDNEWHGPDGWHGRYLVNGEHEVLIDCYGGGLDCALREMSALADLIRQAEQA